MAVNFPSIGGRLTQPTVPVAGAPAQEDQMGRWAAFRQRLATDPNLRMALLMTGLNMLRTPQAGQTGFDTFAEGALTGVQTLDALRQRDVAAGVQKREEGRADRRLAATEAGVEQRGEALKIQRDSETQRRVEAQQRYALGLEKLRQERALAGAPSKLTGPEREMNQFVEDMVSKYPDRFPNTEEGRRDARLWIRDLEAVAANPTSIVTLVDKRAGDVWMSSEDADMTLDEARQIARQQIQEELRDIQGRQTIGGRLEETAPEVKLRNDLLGQGGASPDMQRFGTIEPSGNPEKPYVLRYPDKSVSADLSEQDAEMAKTRGQAYTQQRQR